MQMNDNKCPTFSELTPEFTDFLRSRNPLWNFVNLSQNRIKSSDEPIEANNCLIEIHKPWSRGFIFNFKSLVHLKQNENNSRNIEKLTTIVNKFNDQRLSFDLDPFNNLEKIISTVEDNTIDRWVKLSQLNGECFIETDGNIRVHISRFDAGHLPRGGGQIMLCIFLKYLINAYPNNSIQVDLLSSQSENRPAYEAMGFERFDGNNLSYSPNFKLNFDKFNVIYERYLNQNLLCVPCYVNKS